MSSEFHGVGVLLLNHEFVLAIFDILLDPAIALLLRNLLHYDAAIFQCAIVQCARLLLALILHIRYPIDKPTRDQLKPIRFSVATLYAWPVYTVM